MAPLKYFLVMNPTARSGAARKDCLRIIDILKSRNVVFEYQMTSRKDEAIEISQQATQKDYDVIVAVGGDGTICEVITGMLRENGGCNKKLGVLHVGTSPDFNRHCQIPVKLNEAVDALFLGKSKEVDVGKVMFGDVNGIEQTFYFGSSVNIGLGPYIANRANSRHRKYLGDFLGTLLSSLSSVWNFKGVDLKVNVDGEERGFATLINLTIGKDPYLASGMRVFNDVLIDDGRFFLFSLKKGKLLPLLLNVHKLYIGNFLEYKNAAIQYGKVVQISSDKDVFIEFDGDMRGKLPAKVEVVQKGLEVVVS